MAKITSVHAREILDSRGNPTVEAEITLSNGVVATAAVPSGASTGTREAIELRDGDKKRYLGKGVLKAVSNVNTIISKEITGMDSAKQVDIDKKMISLDGTENKSKLGANAILAVSLAVCRAESITQKLPLYEYIRKCYGLSYTDYKLPVPLMNILNGGEHADNNVDLQEFMILPVGATKFSEALKIGVEVFHNLKVVLKGKKYNTSVGDEGGFAPNLGSNEEALQVIMEAIEKAGYKPGKDVLLGLDCAASELFEDGIYTMAGEPKDQKKSSNQMIDYYKNITGKYPVVSIEDGLSEADWEGWKNLTVQIGGNVQLVGDDIFVTNTKIFSEGIKQKIANSILIKVNQIGSLTETVEAVQMAYKSGYTAVISHRSGETEDPFIADLAVALNTGQIKTGSASRTDRVCKYNQLMRIEEQLGNKASYTGFKK